MDFASRQIIGQSIVLNAAGFQYFGGGSGWLDCTRESDKESGPRWHPVDCLVSEGVVRIQQHPVVRLTQRLLLHYREIQRLNGRPPNVLGKLVVEGVSDEDFGERRRLSGVRRVYHVEDLEPD